MPQSVNANGDKSESSDGVDSEIREKENEWDKNGSNEGANGHAKSNKSQSKTKDLSHVPCKFFKVGSCTAGPTCPFSHQLAEPGQQKQVCTWFVKGSCKFGHKCALAHVLPGQPPTMDRRNKRAALAAAGGGSGRSGDRDRERDRRTGSSKSGAQDPAANGEGSASRKDSSVARVSSRAPITISKAGALPLPSTISAPVTAPPLRDSDFTFAVGYSDNFDLSRRPSGRDSTPLKTNAPTSSENHDVVSGSDIPNAAISTTTSEDKTTHPSERLLSSFDARSVQAVGVPARKPSPLPLSQHTKTRQISASRSNLSSDFGFGPVGSPPRSSPRGGSLLSSAIPISGASGPDSHSGVVVNGFSLSTSPVSHKFEYETAGGFGASPFSPPGVKSIFMPYGGESSNLTNQILSSKPLQGGARGIGHAHSHSASLLDRSSGTFWDPESRRGSLPQSVPDNGILGEVVEDEDLEEFIPSSLTDLLTPGEKERRLSRTGGLSGSQRPSLEAHHQRYPHSLPATTLLDNVKSLWDGSRPGQFESSLAGRTTRSTGIGATEALEGGDWSTGSPGKGFMGGGGPFNDDFDKVSSTHLSPSNASAAFLRPSAQSLRTYSTQTSTSELKPTSVARLNQTGTTLPAEAGSIPVTSTTSIFAATRDVSNSAILFGLHQTESGFNYGPTALSPSTRARRSHEPGQSLPQGLAAGLSRLHLIPVPASSTSPPIPALGTSPGSTSGHDWAGSVPGNKSDTPASNLSSSSQHQGRGQTAPFTFQGGNVIRKPWLGHTLSSPLSQPVITNDEEDGLFAMDEEK